MPRSTKPETQASLLFDGRKASVAGAAFAAATQIDNLDGHDGYNPTKGHIGCAVVPALIAFAEAHPDLPARDALDLLAMSYGIGARAAIALHRTVPDYHTSGAWNALAVATIGCRLHDATRPQLREALGIAEYHGPRSQMMREIAHPTMLHDGSGMGALTGSMAALLALRGFQGAPAITVEADEVADIWADLGVHWTIGKNYIKPYPVCRWAYAPLDGLRSLMLTHGLDATQIARVDVQTFRESAALLPGMPETTGQAQYSLAFALAAMMRHGQLGPDQISGAGLKDHSVETLIPQISVTEDAGYSGAFPARRLADVTVTLTDGTHYHTGEVEARGGPEAPLSLEEVQAKLHLFAEPLLGKPRTDALWRMRKRLTEPDAAFADLIALVTPPA
jgi:2-methylcitrate dehydratase PrpD